MGSLRVRNVGKAYKRYRRKWERAAEWMGLGVRHELAWVLRDVGFEVAPGEAVGIVGANGAGKSTLLKVITGTVRPTAGTFEVGGRIAALLELGVGFHPDFTGRQNVYMAGHIAGLAAPTIASLMSSIEGFAEIGDYIEQPVRTYSTGMQVRLAFSIATALRPDILVVDEALSVGDAYFQHKSFDRIRQFRDQGTTLLLVSHSAAVIKTLCDRAILLDHGRLLRDDAPDAVLDYYNAMIAVQRADYEIRQAATSSRSAVTRSGDSSASIETVQLLVGDAVAHACRSGDSGVLRLMVHAHAALPQLTAGILIRDRLGNDVFGTNTYHLGASRVGVLAGERFAVDFDFPHLDLGVGSYSVSAALHTRDTHVAANFDWWDRALVFEVVPGRRPVSVGVAALDVGARWTGAAAGISGTRVGSLSA